jgi:hypothetical protein
MWPISISDTDIADAIRAGAGVQQVPDSLVQAICQQESSMNPWALRYEPTYRWLYGDQLKMTPTERHAQMCSWGLMQVMGALARELGFQEDMPKLCVPTVNIDYGCKQLRRLYDKYFNWVDVIAAYNAGSPRRIGSLYVNQSYVDRVTGFWQAAERAKGAQI